jgi:hypothetical protein
MSNKTANKAENAIFNIYRGCGWLLINLFILGFLCWGLYGSFVGYRVESNGETTQGHVVALDHVDGGTYSAIVEFEVNGQTYSLDDDSASNPPKYEIGENVTVRYDRSNPNIAHIDGVMPVWLFPSCAVIILFLALIGVNIWGWRAWKRGEEMIDLF